MFRGKHTLVVIELIVIGSWLFPPGPAHAQTATPTSRLAWDQAAPALAEAQGYTYKTYSDGAVSGVTVAATCSGTTSPFVCSIPFPAFTPGPHQIELTAGNIAGESPKSAAFAFTFVVLPSPPSNVRIVAVPFE